MLKNCRKYFLEERASIAILFAILLPILVGFAALAFEVGSWLRDTQELQQVADIAAVGGAKELALRGTSGVSDRATYLATLNSFTAESGNTITVNTPPQSGSFTQDKNAVEVILTQKTSPNLSSYFGFSPFDMKARAVATVSSKSCIVLLNTSASSALSLSNGVKLTLDGCGISVNSSDSKAVTVVGGAKLTASFLRIVGGSSVSNGAKIDVPGGEQTGSSPAADPYSSLPVPSSSTCTKTNFVADTSQTLSPGVYCNGLTIGNGIKTTLNPGVYVIKGGTFSLQGGSTTTGTGVTIILTGSSSSGYATVNIGNGSTLNLTAPTTGTYSGVAFFQDRNAPAGSDNIFEGGSTQNITGDLYFPKQGLSYSNGSKNGGNCMNIIADTLTMTGGTKIQSCSTGGSASGLVKLVE